MSTTLTVPPVHHRVNRPGSPVDAGPVCQGGCPCDCAIDVPDRRREPGALTAKSSGARSASPGRHRRGAAGPHRDATYNADVPTGCCGRTNADQTDRDPGGRDAERMRSRASLAGTFRPPHVTVPTLAISRPAQRTTPNERAVYRSAPSSIYWTIWPPHRTLSTLTSTLPSAEISSVVMISIGVWVPSSSRATRSVVSVTRKSWSCP